MASAGAWVLPDGRGEGGTPADGVAPGWRWIAANGLEVQVPTEWAINPACPDGDYVLRADLLPQRPKCAAGPDPASLTAVRVDAVTDASGLTEAPVGAAWSQVSRSDGGPAGAANRDGSGEAVRARASLDDGRTAWLLGVPRLGRAVTVTTRDEALAERILAGVRLVDGVDAAGCPMFSPGMPQVLAAGKPAQAGLSIPDDVSSVSVCLFGADGVAAGAGDGRTASASQRLSGGEARRVVDALRSAPAGLNRPPDVSAVMCMAGGDRSGVELRLHRANGATSSVWVSHQLCSGVYGMSDGTGTAQVTKEVLEAAAAPLGVFVDVSFLGGGAQG